MIRERDIQFNREILALKNALRLLSGKINTTSTEGISIELRKGTTYIQWRSGASSEWNNLISLEEMKGADGDDASIETHENEFDHSNIHAPGSDNQDLSGKVDKVTGSSLVTDVEKSTWNNKADASTVLGLIIAYGG